MKIGIGRRGVSFLDNGRDWRLPSLLYADDLVLCGKSEEELRVTVGRFAEVCRRGLRVNSDKIKVMVLNGEEGLECEVYVDGIHLEHVSEFKYLGCVLDKSGTYGAKCRRKVARGRSFAGAIKSLVMLGICSLSVLVLHETLFFPVLMYGSETML